jgi:hypothetical protein
MSGQHRYFRSRRPFSRLAILAASIVFLVAGITAGSYVVIRTKDSARIVGTDVASRPSRSAPSASTHTTPSAVRHHHRHRHPRATPTPTPAPSPSTSASSGVVPVSTANCGGASPNTPGGPDPWGGCWPGPDNTGPSSGTAFTPYHGSCTIAANNAVVDAKTINCDLDVTGSNVTIENSEINGTVHNNGNGHLLIENSVLNGGDDHSETVGGSDITILGSNLYGDQHEFHCGSGCTLENSWLHDNFNGNALGWHQNGFLSNGGSNFSIVHNSVYCVGGCTADIAFIPDDDISNATVSKNLLVATQYASYCLYPSSAHPAKPGVVEEMTITDNVFQRGPQGDCAGYGPVYGWDTPTASPGDGYHNVWSGNVWDNGHPVTP